MGQPFAYMRKSSVRDAARDTSPETQEREVRALAKRQGEKGVLTFLADWDVSGRAKYTGKRPGYLALVDAVTSGEASAVYSYSLSRLGRSVAELSRFFDLCRDHKVPVRLVADAVDTSTASGLMHVNMLSAVAQFEADIASERIRAMYATKRARGEDLRTSRRYGEADGEDDADVLAAFREAGSYSGAARDLNARGIAARSGGKWWSSSVAVVVARLDATVARGPAQRGVARGGSAFTLARLLSCPTCGKRLTGSRLKLPQGGTRVRYACRFAESMAHPRVAVSEHLILPAIRAEVARLETPREVVQDAADLLAGLEAKRERVVDMYADGTIDKAERERRIAVIRAEVQRIDARRVVRAIPQVDWDGPPRELNAVLRALFDRIELEPDTFQPKPKGFIWTVPEWRSEEPIGG
jgi:DNA invertase Pin-like site-specific DNA recombinase